MPNANDIAERIRLQEGAILPLHGHQAMGCSGGLALPTATLKFYMTSMGKSWISAGVHTPWTLRLPFVKTMATVFAKARTSHLVTRLGDRSPRVRSTRRQRSGRWMAHRFPSISLGFIPMKFHGDGLLSRDLGMADAGDRFLKSLELTR